MITVGLPSDRKGRYNLGWTTDNLIISVNTVLTLCTQLVTSRFQQNL